jgi:hypothetical protein
MAGGKLLKPVPETFLVCYPFSRKKHEAVEHHAGAEDGYVLDRFFENYIEVSMHRGGVGHPPEVDPVSVDLWLLVCHPIPLQQLPAYLVIGDEHHTLWEVALESPILGLAHLSSNTLVSTDSHRGWRPPVGHSGTNDAKVLLRHGHPCVE